jgi:hypothetical protein
MAPDTLASTAAVVDHVDVWIGTEYDLQQLEKLGVVAANAPAIAVDHYPMYDRAVANNAKYMVMPIAARNYLVSISNSDLLAAIPATTADMMSINNQITGRALQNGFFCAEGRWFKCFSINWDRVPYLPMPVQFCPTKWG